MNTAAGNRALAAALILAAIASVALFRTAGPAVPEGALLVFFLIVPSLLTVGGLILLAQPARVGLQRASLVGIGVYLVLGVLVTLVGIPGYIDGPALAPHYVLGWPAYVVWLHGCPVGVGIWGCPGG